MSLEVRQYLVKANLSLSCFVGQVWWNEDAPSLLEGDFDRPLRYLVDGIDQEMGEESTAGQPRGVLALTARLRESQASRADLPKLVGPVERLLLGER